MRSFARKLYRTRDQARADVFGYIEVFSKSTRRPRRWGTSALCSYEEQGQLA